MREIASQFVLRQVLRGDANCEGSEIYMAPPVQSNCFTFAPLNTIPVLQPLLLQGTTVGGSVQL